MEITTRKRTSRYLVKILHTRETCWPRICLEEEFRAWKNEQASKWLKSLENALGEIGQGQILEMIRTRADPQLVFNWH